MVRELSLVLLSIVLTACAAPVAVSGAETRDTGTIHNPEATHVWAFQKDALGNDYVLYCDASWPAAGRPLCVRFPHAFASPGATEGTVPAVERTGPPVAASPK
jgi:hypothetical protein